MGHTNNRPLLQSRKQWRTAKDHQIGETIGFTSVHKREIIRIDCGCGGYKGIRNKGHVKCTKCGFCVEIVDKNE